VCGGRRKPFYLAMLCARQSFKVCSERIDERVIPLDQRVRSNPDEHDNALRQSCKRLSDLLGAVIFLASLGD
jgi:hypothetical protein